MKAKIHRGADEVGGSCVELAADAGDRIVLDLGLPLSAEFGDELALPQVAGLDGGDPTLRAILVSHGHPDHFGLVSSISAEVPLYMGAAASRILGEAAFFTPLGLDREPDGTFTDRRSIEIGSFTITPYLIDHSAFDAYALLVEADGARLFYTADLRAHGRKRGSFERLITDPPAHVDSMLLEGTTVGRHSDTGLSEVEVERLCTEIFSETPGMVLTCFSPQNIDRLVSVYKATLRSGRSLVIDLYAAAVAAATSLETIPQASWERVRVYVPNSQRIQIKRSEQFWRVDKLGANRIYAEELACDPHDWVLLFRASMGPELKRAGLLELARALWMMWPGYLEGESGRRTRESFSHLGLNPQIVHASGHASVEDLQRLALAIDADRVIPIHTDQPQSYFRLFDRVTQRANGEWWEV